MADYTVKLDTQGEQLMTIAVNDWIKSNTVTTNTITKKLVDGKEVEITTPTQTVPNMDKPQLIQKWINEKLTEIFTRVKSEKASSIQQKYEVADEVKKARIQQILGVV